MKKILLTLSFTFSLFATLFAQTTKGHITYNVEISSDDPQMQQAIPMFAGSTFEMYFTENNSRTNLNMGSFITTSIITDTKKDKILMLMSGMMGKMAVQSTISEMKEDAQSGDATNPQDDSIDQETEYTVELTNETKEIQGYTCKKAILRNEEGTELIYWYTEEINFSKEGQNYFNEDVPGFPMEFETFNNGMKMTMTVTEYSQELGEKESVLFNLTIPEGYKEMTTEEMENMGQGM